MYERLLLALDGSPPSEKAIPHAMALARAFKAELHVIRVVPLAVSASHADGGPVAALSTLTAEADEASAYLNSVAAQLSAEGLSVQTAVRSGDVADELLHQAAQMDADLIVMSTHGRSGVGRWVYGSVADRILRQAEIPVLLVRATE
ncbi:MAG: universal stress protein [Armatimonadetes bacterium]|nr:universal stress protein [Armatimonadota bacterium]